MLAPSQRSTKIMQLSMGSFEAWLQHVALQTLACKRQASKLDTDSKLHLGDEKVLQKSTATHLFSLSH